MKTIYPDTSKEAFESLDKDDIATLHKKILVALGEIKEGTFEMIADRMNIDSVKVWKRLSELNKEGLIHRPGHKLPLKSGRGGYVWALGKGDNVEKVYEKGNLTAADHAEKIISHSTNKLIQKSMFDWDFDMSKK